MIEPEDCEHDFVQFDSGVPGQYDTAKCVDCFQPMRWDEQARCWVSEPEQIEAE